MNFDQQLSTAFHSEHPRHRSPSELRQRVLLKVWRRRLQRGCEVGLSLAALVIFGSAISTEHTPVGTWLILPFFVVYIPVMWTLILREPPLHSASPSQPVSSFAQQRLLQIRATLRETWLAKQAARALLLYAALATAAVLLLAIPHAGLPALFLCLYAIAWFVGTELFVRWSSRRLHTEYRALLRVAGTKQIMP